MHRRYHYGTPMRAFSSSDNEEQVISHYLKKLVQDNFIKQNEVYS
jgi:hypothetical protein